MNEGMIKLKITWVLRPAGAALVLCRSSCSKTHAGHAGHADAVAQTLRKLNVACNGLRQADAASALRRLTACIRIADLI